MTTRISLFILLAIAGRASAESNSTQTAAVVVPATIALDYKATDRSCVDAGRFADEVSAKLGFVPWDARARATIRVRIGREGAQFSGSFRNTDGSAKVVDGATCSEVTSSLAVTVASAVDRMLPREELGTLVPAAAAPSPANGPVAGGTLAVRFLSADGRRIDVSLNSAGGVGVTTGGAQIVTAFFEGVCTTPCATRLQPGRHYLTFRDPDSQSIGGGRFLIDEPTTITMHHKSRSRVRRGLLVTGIALTGASVAAMMFGGTPGLIAGGVSIGFGIGLGAGSLFVRDTFTTTVTHP